MKKVIKSLALALMVCAGMVAFTACDGLNNGKPISINEYHEYVQQESVVKTFAGYKLNITGTGETAGTIKATALKSNGAVNAYVEIDMYSTTEGTVELEMFLYQNKIYIDNGIQKYWVNINSNWNPVTTSEEETIAQVYANTLIGYFDLTDALEIPDEVAKDCVITQTNANHRKNFEINVKQVEENTTDNVTLTQTAKIKIDFKDDKIQKFSQVKGVTRYYTDTQTQVEEHQTAKVEIQAYEGSLGKTLNVSDYVEKA